MFINMTFMQIVQVPIVEVVRVPFKFDRSMTAAWTVCMRMPVVNVA